MLIKVHLQVLVTGVTPGSLGAQTAISIARANPTLIILAARNSSKIAALAEEIARISPNVKTHSLVIDLGSQASVRSAAAEVLALNTPIDVLINNAGVMAEDPYKKTVDGIENTFGINHIGHFLLTNLLMPRILEAASKRGEARVVNVSSGGQRRSDVCWDDINFQDGATFSRWSAYGQSKTANVLFSRALAEKLGAKGVRSFSISPGGTYDVDGCRQLDLRGSFLVRLLTGDAAVRTALVDQLHTGEFEEIVEKANMTVKTLPEGAGTTVAAAFDDTIGGKHEKPSAELRRGGRLIRCRIERRIFGEL